jgi:hypothetical protein|tara:strand:+ start:111 stop:386 length:276 start_codon:yes stop_codon:yes gene_type:complete
MRTTSLVEAYEHASMQQLFALGVCAGATFEEGAAVLIDFPFCSCLFICGHVQSIAAASFHVQAAGAVTCHLFLSVYQKLIEAVYSIATNSL